MSNEPTYEYARDDFNYPRFARTLVERLLNAAVTYVQNSAYEQALLNRGRWALAGLSILTMLFGSYLISALFLGTWLFLDQVYLRVFIDKSIPANRFKHLMDEIPIVLGVVVHMWLEGHIWTGVAGLVGISGMYLLTNLQMKYDLLSIQIPQLFFLRWDRLGFVFLFSLFGAWPGDRAYLFVVLIPWFILALTYYDYIWIMIQLMKKNR